MKRHSRGLSLVEVLATLFLFSIVLAVISQLLLNYSRVVKFSIGQDRSVQAALVTLSELRDEIKEATEILMPNTSTVAPTLEIRKVIPGVSRFPNPVPLQPPTGWTLFPTTSLVTLRYQIANQNLERQVVSGLPATTTAIASNISDLQTRLLAGGNVEVSFLVAEQKLTRKLVTSVFRLR